MILDRPPQQKLHYDFLTKQGFPPGAYALGGSARPSTSQQKSQPAPDRLGAFDYPETTIKESRRFFLHACSGLLCPYFTADSLQSLRVLPASLTLGVIACGASCRQGIVKAEYRRLPTGTMTDYIGGVKLTAPRAGCWSVGQLPAACGVGPRPTPWIIWLRYPWLRSAHKRPSFASSLHFTQG